MLHYASRFSAELVKRGCYVKVVVPDYSDASSYSKKITLVKIKSDPSFGSFLKQTFFITNWWKMIRVVFSSDVVHFMDNHPWMLILLPLSRFFRKEIYITMHDPLLHSGENRSILSMAVRMVNYSSKAFASKIIIHSSVFLPFFSKKDQEKTVVVHHGIYDQFGAPDLQKRNYRKVLFFGRIVEYKGLDILLAAWKNLSLENAQLIIAGEGDISPYKKLLENQKNIEVLNYYIDEKKIREIFSKASLLVLPYKDATQSGVLSIAYYYSMPVIATSVGGLPDVVIDKKTGWLINPNSVLELTNALSEALSSADLLKRRGKNAKIFAEENLSWEKIVSKIYSTF